MKKNIIKLIFVILISGLTLICASRLFAAAPNLPFIDKAKIRVFITPGEQGLGELFVENPTEEPRRMHLYLQDWYYLPGGDGAKEFVPAGTLPNSCASWINFSPADFVLPPFGKQRISYSVKMPENAKGTHYAVLFFETQIAQAKEAAIDERDAGIDLKVRIASLFFVDAQGATDRNARIGNLSVKNDTTSGGLSIQLDFLNTGNADITAATSFYLMNKEGVVAARGEFNTVYTAPQDKAKLAALWKKPLPQGSYDLVINLNLGKGLEETSGKRLPAISREAEIIIGQKGEVIQVGQLN